MTDRPPIPAHIQRQVRQECRFGCVVCGMPVFQYDHIVDFSETLAHEPSNLALLCPNHHADKTSGRLSRQRVHEARQAPFNGTRNKTAAYQLEASSNIELWIGSNQTYVADLAVEYPVLWINGQSFLTIHRDGELFAYSADVTDESGGRLLSIDHGELTVATDVWDYRYEGRTLSIRSGQGTIIFEAEIADTLFRVQRGAFVDGFAAGILVTPDGAAIFSMSGLHVGQLRDGRFGVSNSIGIGVVRQSCYTGHVPGGGYLRTWDAEYEERADQLRQRMESGAAGSYPPGLATFRRYPRDS